MVYVEFRGDWRCQSEFKAVFLRGFDRLVEQSAQLCLSFREEETVELKLAGIGSI